MRKVYLEEIEEDLSGQAGWMYTDLMLALMVIFLATVSFVPQMSSNQVVTQDKISEYTYSKIFGESMNNLYETFDLDSIKMDIAEFKASRGLPAGAEIVFAQYVGGYSTASENSSLAISRALAFSQRLDKEGGNLLTSAATTLSSSNVLKANQVIIRFTFAVPSKIGNQ
jgi:hypothetical protein